MNKAIVVKTVNDFIDLINNSKSGRYEIGQGIDDIAEPLKATIYFDSAKWVYYPEPKTKCLVLYSEQAGNNKGRISISDVKGVEEIRKGVRGVTVAVIAGNKEQYRYIFYINKGVDSN